jgi:nitrogen regulatory protein PII-like uncharacterized protein
MESDEIIYEGYSPCDVIAIKWNNKDGDSKIRYEIFIHVSSLPKHVSILTKKQGFKVWITGGYFISDLIIFSLKKDAFSDIDKISDNSERSVTLLEFSSLEIMLNVAQHIHKILNDKKLLKQLLIEFYLDEASRGDR